MNKEDALDILKKEIQCYANKADFCSIHFTCASCPLRTSIDERVEAMKLAIKFIEGGND